MVLIRGSEKKIIGIIGCLMMFSLISGLFNFRVEAGNVDPIDLFTGEPLPFILLEGDKGDSDERKSTEFLVNVENLLFEQVNQEREKVGLQPYKSSEKLQSYARNKSRDMALQHYFSHEDLKGKSVADQLKQEGVVYTMWGENIGSVSQVMEPKKIVEELMKVWMSSEGHKANILSKDFTEIGIGIYEKDGKIFATQDFLKK